MLIYQEWETDPWASRPRDFSLYVSLDEVKGGPGYRKIGNDDSVFDVIGKDKTVVVLVHGLMSRHCNVSCTDHHDVELLLHESDDTVLKVKLRVQDQLGIPAARVRVSDDAPVLDPDESKSGSTDHLRSAIGFDVPDDEPLQNDHMVTVV